MKIFLQVIIVDGITEEDYHSVGFSKVFHD